MFACARCNKIQKRSSTYPVTSPLCLGSKVTRFCPQCFQHGIDCGEIVWLGDNPYGVCSDHEHADHGAVA